MCRRGGSTLICLPATLTLRSGHSGVGWPSRAGFSGLLVVLALLWAGPLVAQSTGEEAGNETRRQVESFLSDESPQAFEILSRNPQLLKERPVQAKVYRSQRSQNPGLRQRSYRLCLDVPDLDTLAPLIARRCDNSFIGNDVTPKKVFLQLLLDQPELQNDLRIVGLVSTALRSDDGELADLARETVERYPSLKQNPAVLGALGGEERRLPDYDLFEKLVDPVLMASGEDGKSCLDCHHSRPVFFLPQPGPQDDPERVSRERYSSALRVIRLDDPERSLLLTKPTLPKPSDPDGPSDPDHHSGGPRFRKGDADYESLLRWIRSAGEGTAAQSSRE